MRIRLFQAALSSIVLVIVGIFVFIFGLLAVLSEQTVVGALSTFLPDSMAISIFGLLMMLIGQFSLVFGVTRFVINRFLTFLQIERKISAAAFDQSIQQLQNRMREDKQVLIASYNQTASKIDSLMSHQRAFATQSLSSFPTNCKFCGTRMEQSQFCPFCGKAN